MDLYQEYASWVKEIEDFYLEVTEHHLSLYERFMPIYEVLNYIYLNVSNQKLEKTDDIDKIFNVGFEYLHDQIATSKMYLEVYFKNDFHHFMEYEELLSLLFYIEDVRYELSEKNTKADSKKLVKLIEDIEAIIQHHNEIPENYVLFVDDQLKKIISEDSFEFYGIIDIFIDVAETLGLYLYEDDDITIGREV